MMTTQEALVSYNEDDYVFPINPIHRIRVPPPCHRDALKTVQERRKFDVLVMWLLHNALEESTLEVSYVFTREFQRCKKKDNCYYELLVRPKDPQGGVSFNSRLRRTEVDVLAAVTRCLHVVGANELTPGGSVSRLLDESSECSVQVKVTCVHNKTTQTPYLPAPRQDAYPRVRVIEEEVPPQGSMSQQDNNSFDDPQPRRRRVRQTARKSTGGASFKARF